MCGIAGWYRRGNDTVSKADIAAQCNAIIHRGPDDFGDFLDGNFGMGMRRLSIVDLSGGHQPITSPDGRYTITFNGEVYNHQALRPRLEADGWVFSTNSDSETLLAAFICLGEKAWLQLEGMYAVAIWDRSDRSLTLARDPLGIKPLYISEQNGGLAFASELKSLTCMPALDFNINDRAVHDFFRFGHIQRPRTIYREVRQLEPGHWLRISPKGDVREQKFWTPQLNSRSGLSEAEWIREMRDRLLKTVKSHMMSDVPIGVFLSGGVDSAAVAAAMMKQTDAPVTAITIGFPGNTIDESNTARDIARHLGCDHVILPVELGEARDVMPDIISSLDEPLSASAVIPCWYASRLASEHVKVVLCGEGGDELFAGYKRQHNALKMAHWRNLIRATGPIASALAKLPVGSSQRLNLVRQQIDRVRDSASLSSGFERCIAGTEITPPRLRARLFDPEFLRRNENSVSTLAAEYFGDQDLPDADMIEQFMIGDLSLHMPSALLPRLDRTSMMHSLEARVPFLTHQFVDWALTIPTEQKTKARGKHILREAIRPWLPEGILDRKKQGFQIPLADWFRDDFADFAKQVYNQSGLAKAGYLNDDEVIRLFDDHRIGRANYAKTLYAITVFSCWMLAQRSR